MKVQISTVVQFSQLQIMKAKREWNAQDASDKDIAEILARDAVERISAASFKYNAYTDGTAAPANDGAGE